MKNIRLTIILALLLPLLLCSCGGNEKRAFADTYDRFSDQGQYNMPEQKLGIWFWTLSASKSRGERLIVDNLLSESVVGLLALAVNEGRSEVMAWMEHKGEPFLRIMRNLPMEHLGTVGVWDYLATEEARGVIDGYVLYDIGMYESINAATTAAHVYNGVMIERSERERIEKLGYRMLFDASAMTLADSWKAFRDKCVNSGLVLMPAYSSNQRSTAISARFMTVNLNKVSYKPEHGNNKELLIEVLGWLEPLSPVFGWEQAVGEDAFVGLVSSTGNYMIPYDWTVNTPLLWANYRDIQNGHVKVTDPTTINYGDANHYISFYMSDGDNVQWMFTGFDSEAYFDSPYVAETKMTFGFPVANLSMVSPMQYGYLLEKQNPGITLMESLGGGYYYADTFAELKDRPAILDKAARNIASHMRQHRNNVLALVCMDACSDRAKEAYEAFIRNNDRLAGIVVIQYTPYAGGEGEVMWFRNSEGYHIPVITVAYSIWNYGKGMNGEREGTPAYIASKYNELAASAQGPTFSATSVHAWSWFTKADNPADLTGENAGGGTIHGVESAKLCMDRLGSDIKVVNMEELIWQLRMHTYPRQTKRILKSYKNE